MKHNLKISITFVLAAILLSGCMGTSGVYSKIKRNTCSVSYIHDSPKILNKSNIKIHGDFKNNAPVPKQAEVNEIDFFILPLVLINYGYTTQEIILGQDNIRGDYFYFLQNSFMEEVKRSGNFIPVEEKDSSDYYFNVVLDSCKTYTYYEESAFVSIGGYSIEKSVRPGISYLELDIKIFRTVDNDIVFKDRIKILKKGQYVLGRSRNDYEMFKHAVNNLGEALSFSTKYFISNFVIKLNSVVSK